MRRTPLISYRTCPDCHRNHWSNYDCKGRPLCTCHFTLRQTCAVHGILATKEKR